LPSLNHCEVQQTLTVGIPHRGADWLPSCRPRLDDSPLAAKELRSLSVSADPVAAIDDKLRAINKPS
jgi:hypothetical protein